MLSSVGLLSVAALLATQAMAAPLSSSSIVSRGLTKRASPTYVNFQDLEDRQEVLEEAFRDVLEMASYIVTLPQPAFFTDYFPAADKDDVYGVFNDILGGDPDSTTGGDVLGSITIDGNDFNNGCTNKQQLAYTVPGPASSRIHFCDTMWNTGFTVKDEMTIEGLGDRVTWRMEHIGQIMLHEFTHHKLIAGTIDVNDGTAYGPIDTRALSGDLMAQNADNWAWFATQQLWTVLASKQFGAPIARDDIDPRCQESICRIQ
ncbi:hypothetical protein MBLNU459_g4264t1 [Dothideomycetes sp. NU459]